MKRIYLPLIAFIIAANLFAQPVISSFAPASGNAGTVVTIKGTGFSPVAGNNVVYFGSARSTVIADSDTMISVVASGGGTYQPLTVTTGNLTAYSSIPFVTTFTGDSGPFTSSSFMPKTDLSAGIYPHAISMADFNNDGKNDLLVCRGSSSSVSVFRNTSIVDSISFAAKSDIAVTGTSHECSATGDLDGDGKTDFVITNTFGANSVSVFRNTSSASTISFAPKIDFAADNAPYSVSIGDFDGDGKPDLAIANNGSSLINIYRNTSAPGTISFGARIDITANTNPYSVAIGDLNNDGKPELVYTTQGSSLALLVMENTSTPGNISFSSPVNYASIDGAFVVSIGDLDSDGKPDIAASSGGGTIVVLANTSSGGTISFSGQQNLSTGGYTVCIAIADLNGDGKPDLATANRNTNNTSVFRNTSTPGNISFDNYVPYNAEADPFFVIAGDLNNDGRPEICVANSSSENVSILKNIIGANITPTITSFTPAAGINGTVIKIKGTNFTGTNSVKFGGTEASSFIMDSATGITAIVGTGASGDVSVINSYSTGSLAGFIFNGPIINTFSPAVGITGTVITITGTNFTGTTSVKFGTTLASSFTVVSSTTITAVVGAGSSGNVSVTTPTGTAFLQGFSFGPPVITSFTPASGPVGTPVTITGNNFSSITSDNIVFFGAVRATVTSATPSQLTAIAPAGTTYQSITVTTNNLTAISSMPFSITFPSDSTGLSLNSFSAISNFSTGAYPFAVSIKDLNNDGKPDLITANGIGNGMSVLKNTSTISHLSFDLKSDYASGSNPERIATGDLDGDGKPDIVVTNFNSGSTGSLSIFKNTSTNSTISFANKIDYATGNGTLGLAVNDMDGDGKPDVITASGNSGVFSFFKNTTVAGGAISFASKQDFTSLFHGDNLLVADLDNDNRPDLVISNFSGNNLSVFRNTSTSGVFSLAPSTSYATGSNPGYISAADLNGDGKLDLAVTNYNSIVSFYINNSSNGNISLSPDISYNAPVTNLSMSDLDGDGKIDCYAGKISSGSTSVLANTYSGSFSLSFSPAINFTTGNFDSFTEAGDIDGDGIPELIAANPLLNTVSILRNKKGDPVIKSLSDSTAVKGQVITITGSGFNGTTSIQFGGVPADSFVVVSSKRIDATVSGGASGTVTISTPSGNASMEGFSFIPEVKTTNSTIFCKGSVAILTSTAISGNQWYKDGALIAGSVSDTLHATTSGNYFVKATADGITTSSPNSIDISVTAINPPLIAKDSMNNLISSYKSGNQWSVDGNIIPGAVNSIYQPEKNGNYTVTVTTDGCTSDASASYSFVRTGVINLGNERYVAIYPNPVSDKLSISWSFNDVTVLNVSISDLSGNQLLTKNVTNGTIINISTLPPGIYLVRIYSSDHLKINKSTKIIKGS
jgi:hypothetical protein